MHPATHDPLTRLPNRTLFFDRLEQAIERARRQTTGCALLCVDIDGFRAVNDAHGHDAGDELLRYVGRRLLQAVRGEDTVARIADDTFVILLEQPQDPASAAIKGEKVLATLRVPYTFDLPGGKDIELRISASVGVALFPTHAQTADTLVRVAEDAMSRAQKDGKNRCEMAR
jgi:diguanylate cyclase (GGDEF)-like protein